MKIAALSLVLALTACSGRFEHKSDIAKSDAGAWRRAFVTVEYHPSFTQHGYDNPAQVLHALSIEPEGGVNALYIILGSWQEAYDGKATFEAMKKTTYSLKFAPDGHAIAVSTDAGKSYTIFDLTAATEPLTVPFYCPHHRFESLEPWPDMRSVVMELFDETTGAASTHLHSEKGPAPLAKNSGELLDASLYACKLEANDEPLRRAMLAAFASPWHGADQGRGGDDSVLTMCVANLARREPATAAALREAKSKLSDPMDSARVESALYWADQPAKP